MPATIATPRASAALGPELAATVAALRQVTVLVRTRGPGAGAGVVWDAQGLILTNAHVARGDDATVAFSDGTTRRAHVIGRDRQLDLAALELDPPGAPAVAVRRTAPLHVGELVMAVGHPDRHTGAVTLGIIHAVDTGGGHGDGPRWVRADVRLAPGYSGGPLADAAGHVIGISTLIHGGLALAVPVATADQWVQLLQQPAGGRRPGRRRRAAGDRDPRAGTRAPSGSRP